VVVGVAVLVTVVVNVGKVGNGLNVGNGTIGGIGTTGTSGTGAGPGGGASGAGASGAKLFGPWFVSAPVPRGAGDTTAIGRATGSGSCGTGGRYRPGTVSD